MNKPLQLLLATSILLTGCNQATSQSGATGEIKGKKIAVIRNLGSDDHTKQFIDGAKSQGEKLGLKVDTFLSNGNDAKFQQLVDQAILKNMMVLYYHTAKKITAMIWLRKLQMQRSKLLLLIQSQIKTAKLLIMSLLQVKMTMH